MTKWWQDAPQQELVQPQQNLGGSNKWWEDTPSEISNTQKWWEDSPTMGTPGIEPYEGPEGGRTVGNVIKSMPGTVEGLIKGAAGFTFGSPIAAAVGAYDSLKKGNWDDYADVFNHVLEDVVSKTKIPFTGIKPFEAQTEAGKRVLTLLDEQFFGRISSLGKSAGDNVFEQTNDPALATATQTAIEGVGLLAPIIGGKAIKAGAKKASTLAPADKFVFGTETSRFKLPVGRRAKGEWKAPTFEQNKTPGLVVSFDHFSKVLKKSHPTLTPEGIEAQYRTLHEEIRAFKETKPTIEEGKPVESLAEVVKDFDKPFGRYVEQRDMQFVKEQVTKWDTPDLYYGQFRASVGNNPKTGRPFAESTYVKKFIQHVNREVIPGYYNGVVGKGSFAKNFDEAIIKTEAINAAKRISKLVRDSQGKVPANITRPKAQEILSAITPALLAESGRLFLSTKQDPTYIKAGQAAAKAGETLVQRGYHVKGKDGKPVFYSEYEVAQLQEIASTGKIIPETPEVKALGNAVKNSEVYNNSEANTIKSSAKETIIPKEEVAKGPKSIKEAIDKEVSAEGGENIINPFLKTYEEIFKGKLEGFEISDVLNARKAVPEQVTKSVDKVKDATNIEIDPTKPVEKSVEPSPQVLAATKGVGMLDSTQMSGLNWLINLAGGRAISIFKTDSKFPGTNTQLRELSPAMAEIQDSLWRPEAYSKTPKVMDSYHSMRHTKTGEYMTDLDNIFFKIKPKWVPGLKNITPRRVGGRGGWVITEKQNKQLSLALDPTTSPEVLAKIPNNMKQAAKDIRALDDKIFKEAKEVFTDLEYTKGHLHRVYDHKWMKKNPEQAVEILTKAFQSSKKAMDELGKGIENNSAREAAQRMVDYALENNGSVRMTPEFLRASEVAALGIAKNAKEAKVAAKKASGIDYERVLVDITDAQLGPLLEQSVYKRMTKYAEDTAARTSYAKINGPYNELLYDRLNRANAELAASTAAGGRPLRQYEVQQVLDLWAAFQHIYKSDTYKKWITFQKGYITLLNAALLPLASVASLTEAPLPMYHGGVRAYSKAMGRELFHTLPLQLLRSKNKDIKLFGKDKTRSMIITEQIRKAGDIAAMERMNQMFAGDFTVAGNLVFRANGLYYWTKWMNNLAVGTYDAMVRDYFTRKAAGKKLNMFPQEEVRMQKLMQYYGLDLAEGIKWAKEGHKLEGAFYEKLKKGALTFAEDSVLTPNPAIVPMWHSNPGLAWLKHLKAFPTLIGNTVLRRWGADINQAYRDNGMPLVSGRNATYAVGTGMAMLLTAHISNILTDEIRYGEENPFYKTKFPDDKTRWMIRAAERWGIAGVSQFGLDAIFHSHGAGKLSVVLGPAFSKSERMLTAATSGNPRALAREMARMTPVANVPSEWVDSLTDFYEEFLINNLGPLSMDPRAHPRAKKPKREKS